MASSPQVEPNVPPAEIREPYLRAEEVAAFMNASPKTVLRMARSGKMPAHGFGEGSTRTHWRFKLSEVDEWLQSRHNAAVHRRRPEGGKSL